MPLNLTIYIALFHATSEHCLCFNCRGTSCDDPSRPLGHYWDKELLGETAADDPWNYVFYNATQEGGSSSGFFMNSGFAMEDNEGHAFVIHTEGGDRVGCGVLKKQQVRTVLTASQVGRYPEYTGELQPEGSVEVEFMVDGSLKFSYDMLGLAPECVKCGVHIHTGKYHHASYLLCSEFSQMNKT